MTDIAGFLSGRPDSAAAFASLVRALESLGAFEIRVTKSQIAFRRRRAFAWAWTPDMCLTGKHAPLVLSLSLRRRDPSPRWKEVVEPTPGRYTHHLELTSIIDVDDEVGEWLREAWTAAG